MLKISKSGAKDDWSYDPDKLEDFTSHILIEYIYNRPSAIFPGTRNHACTTEVGKYKAYYPDCWNVFFASSLESVGRKGVVANKLVRLGTMDTATEYRDRENDGPDKVCIVPVPVGAKDKYMCIDLIMPVRAIYLPLSQKVGKIHPDLCTFLMLDFRYRRGVKMMFPDYRRLQDISDGSEIGRFFQDIRNKLKDKIRTLDNKRGKKWKPGSDVPPYTLEQINALDAYGQELKDQVNSKTADDDFYIDDEAEWNVAKEEFTSEIDETCYKAKKPRTSDRDDPEESMPGVHAQHKWQRFSYTEGLGEQGFRTLVIDVPEVYNYLILPRQMRDPDFGLYCPDNDKDVIVSNYPCGLTNTSMYDFPIEKRAFQLLDDANVISDHFGVDVTWQPYEFQEEPASMVSQYFNMAVTTGLSLIPVVGPLASCSYGIFMEALNNPEGFKADNILKLESGSLSAVLATAGNVVEKMATSKAKKVALAEAFARAAKYKV